MPCPEVVLGALSQITRRIRLGFGVALTPHNFTHPVRMAEKVATVDILSKGRVEWGTGRSTPMEQAAFHVERARSKEQWKAAIKSTVGMWEAEYYEEKSEFLDFPLRMVTPKPFQDPHPPCWMAAVSEESAAVAGANSLGMLLLSILRPLSKLSEQIRQYRDAERTAIPLTQVKNNRIAAYTLVHCVENPAELERNKAWESVWWWYRSLAEFVLKWEYPNFSEEERAKTFPHYQLAMQGKLDVHEFGREDMVIVGTVEECMRKFLRYRDLGIDHVICYVQFGHIPHQGVMKTIQLLGDHVIPKLNALGVKAGLENAR